MECRVRKYCHRELKCNKNTYMSREHKAYTYLRIYTLKYKNACIVYYVAVFLGYQVKTFFLLYKTFVEIFFSYMPIMYKVRTWQALHYNLKKRYILR